MNLNNIFVNKYPISQILDPESKAVYEIPKYQREYTWGLKQWEALFDDLMEHGEGYFLGSIICINTTKDSLQPPKLEVVDGQQRITTISIFLTALYSYLSKNKEELDEDQQSDLLQLKKRLVLKKTDDETRVVPQHQNSNLEDYLSLLSEHGIIVKHSTPKNAGNRKIYHAFYYFKKRIDEVIQNEGQKIHVAFKILDKINSAIFVKIDVTNHSDAYTLFESLNDRGTPLSAVDLIKNLLLSKLDLKGNALDYYFNRWTEILKNLGDDVAFQERFFRQNYNAFRKSINEPFINDDRMYPLGPIATRTTLLDIYEKIISKDPEGFLDDVTDASKLYAQITLINQDKISYERKESYLDLQRVQGVPAYLLLLYLLKKQQALRLSEADIIKINVLLVNFFVRRNLTDIPPTRDLTRLFMSFIEEIEEENYIGNIIYEKLRLRLLSRSASDELFEQRLSGPVYDENKGTVRFILCMLAKKGMTREKQQDLWAKYDSGQYKWTVEHIFPQGTNIPDCWVDMIANGDCEKAKEYQNTYVHTLGNLTITGYNSTLSNKSFQEKKERKDSTTDAYIGYKNGLNLNSDVCDKDKWTVDIIKERTQFLVAQIKKTFEI